MTNQVAQSSVMWKDKAATYVVEHSGQLLGAVMIFVAGIFAARLLGRVVMRWLSRKELGLEPPIRMLIVRIVRLLIVLFALIIALGTLNVNIAPLVALIGVGGIGVGLAMQGVLSNPMAGLTIIFTKPFRVGEYIEIGQEKGDVSMITLSSTILTHPDHTRVIIPNRKIVGEILHNFGTMRQLHLAVHVPHHTDLNQALEACRQIVDANIRVLNDPTPSLGISAVE